MSYFKCLSPYIFFRASSIAFRSRSIFLLLFFALNLGNRLNWFTLYRLFNLCCFFLQLLLYGLFLITSFLLLLCLFLLLSLLLLPLLFLLLIFALSTEFLVVDFASVDNDFLCSLLIGEEIGISSEEAKDGVKE